MATVVGGGWKPQDIVSDSGGCLDVGARPAEKFCRCYSTSAAPETAVLRPDALSPLSASPAALAHNTRRYGHPLAGGPGLLGRGYRLCRRLTSAAYEICLATPSRW
jgi:hypothetical protein